MGEGGMMGKKRKQVQRQPNGQPRREPDIPPGVLKRGRDAAIAGLRQREFGTVYGQMLLAREITQAMFDEAARFAGILDAYRRAIGGPARVVAAPVEKGAGGPPVASQDAIADEWQARAIDRYDSVASRLSLRGQAVKLATVKLCEGEYLTWAEREWAKIGLAQLEMDSRGGRR